MPREEKANQGKTNSSLDSPAITMLAVFVVAIAVMFLCDAYDIDKCLHLDSDWPAIICNAVSVIVAVGFGVASLKHMFKQK